jgi:site-specific recombinase XerC
MTLDDALGRFLLQLSADGRSAHTLGQYRRHVRLLGHWCAHVAHPGEIDALRHEDVARFLASPQAQARPDAAPKKATTMNTLRSSLRGFFSYCHKAGFIPQDPTRLLRRALCGAPPPRALPGDEEERLLAALAAAAEGDEARRDHAMIQLMLATGLRVGSVVALNLEDLDLDQGEVWLRRTKGDRPERVFLGQAIREHLRGYLAGKTPGPVFTTRHGVRLNTRQVGRRFAAWVKQAGITRPASPHSLRHSFATNLLRRTGDILLVKEALRHRSIMSTLVYARPDEERLRRALA